jgi:hypothetical protein
VQQQDGITNILVYDPDLEKQQQLYQLVRSRPASEDGVILPWLESHAAKLTPIFSYELARRLWDQGRRDDAFEWYALAGIRARYDGLRCVDTTAAQGIAFLPQAAVDVARGIAAHRAEYGRAGLRALARPDLFAATVSPWWICSHGIRAVRGALQGQTIDGPAWLKPQAEWADLRASLMRNYTQHFEEQDKPQDDPIPMTKTPFPAVSVSFGSIHTLTWLDNERLALSRVDRASSQHQNILSLWQKDRGLTEIARFPGSWCGGNGQIYYVTKVDRPPRSEMARTTFMTGPVGQLREVTLEHQGYVGTPQMLHDGSVMSGAHSRDPIRMSPFDCRIARAERLNGPNGNHWIPLLPGDGFLSYSRPDGTPAERLLYYAQDTAAAVELPIPAKDVATSSIRYAAYKKAYFMSPIVGRPRDGDPMPACRSVWWLQPGGKVEEQCIPTSDIDRNGYTFVPSRIGLMQVISIRNTPHGPKPGGVYLLRADGSREKIHESQTWGTSISPDGCSLAVRSYPQTAGGDTPLSILSLCGRVTTSRN